MTFNDPTDGYKEKTLPLEDVVPFDGSAAQDRFGIDGYAHFAEDARDVLVWIHYLGLLVQDFDPITTDDLCTS